ncbi:hypothetical protein PMIN03_000187 [Paraphaeosphaeria minitans]|uniref:N-terminal alpha/beta hydrolase domain protein n=1 Tax=Paraphaeosphaeria minitans TaxID=565426 RepID=A0A9P6GLJ9_9PLEO|nr:N-terminal alpha/beta hydrolase domain protein [Paraphaeosphaeria minitans]
MGLSEQDVEFKTLDGTVLRGTLYPSSDRGPAIVMSPGFNCVKEMLGLPDAAARFQSAGYTVLLYDPRTTGLSGGEPRNDIDPIAQVGDYSDAISYVSTLSSVNPSEVFIWGMSFSAAVGLCVAALDPRAKGIIAVCPLTDFTYTEEKLPMVLKKCAQDRASQVAGNDPFYLPMLDAQGRNPAGFGVGVDSEQYSKIVEAGKEIAPRHVNRTTVQTYYRMVLWQPFGLWRMIKNLPVLFVVPELDRLSPAEKQLGHWDSLVCPKRKVLVPGVGHMEIMEGDHVDGIMTNMEEFLRDVLEGSVQ